MASIVSVQKFIHFTQVRVLILAWWVRPWTWHDRGTLLGQTEIKTNCSSGEKPSAQAMPTEFSRFIWCFYRKRCWEKIAIHVTPPTSLSWWQSGIKRNSSSLISTRLGKSLNRREKEWHIWWNKYVNNFTYLFLFCCYQYWYKCSFILHAAAIKLWRFYLCVYVKGKQIMIVKFVCILVTLCLIMAEITNYLFWGIGLVSFYWIFETDAGSYLTKEIHIFAIEQKLSVSLTIKCNISFLKSSFRISVHIVFWCTVRTALFLTFKWSSEVSELKNQWC